MMAETHTPVSLLKLTTEWFASKNLPAPRVEAEILLAHVLGCKRLDLYLQHDRPLDDDEVARYRELIRRRVAGEPVQHLTGDQAFFDLKVQVNDKVLIPRPETEQLVEAVFYRVAHSGDRSPRIVAELGTGSGAIAIALAKGWPAAELLAVELSFDALQVAKGNVAANGLENRIHLLHGDLFEPLEGREGQLDLIVSNPPYIPTADIATLDVEVRDHEPTLALDGGVDGLDVIRAIAAEAPRYLKPGGSLFLEIGYDQGEAVRGILEAAASWRSVLILPDMAGRDRIAVAEGLG